MLSLKFFIFILCEEEDKMDLQIASDIHLEFCKSPTKTWETIIKPSAKYLALIGDVGELRNQKHLLLPFLKKVCRCFEKVFYIMGNHEYYSYNNQIRHTKEKLIQNLKKITAIEIPNLVILDNEMVEVDGIKIIGCTLWSSIPLIDRAAANSSMNDYCNISTNIDADETDQHGRLFSAHDSNRLHNECVKFISGTLAECKDTDNVIILTHHAPLTHGTSSPMYSTSSTQCCYSTDLSDLFKPCVKLWAFGHTHWNCDFVYNNVRVVSNPRGYINESVPKDPCSELYSTSKVVSISI